MTARFSWNEQDTRGHRPRPKTGSGQGTLCCRRSLALLRSAVRVAWINQGLRSLHSLNPWLNFFHASGVNSRDHSGFECVVNELSVTFQAEFLQQAGAIGTYRFYTE